MPNEFAAKSVAVWATVDSLYPTATLLAEKLDLPCLPKNDSVQARNHFELILEVTEQGLQIQPCGKRPPGPTRVDFVSGSVAHRRQFGGGKGQMIAKAVGVKGALKPTLLDATAGLGKDAFVLATLGCHVTMLERSPVIHALLEDGLKRAAIDPEAGSIVERMHLQGADSIEWMRQHLDTSGFQVVYLDPMFPHKDKSALVKKEMRAFRPVVGDDSDADQLLELALSIAENRVVVKRPRKAPYLADCKPALQFMGKSSRYDVYPLKKFSA